MLDSYLINKFKRMFMTPSGIILWVIDGMDSSEIAPDNAYSMLWSYLSSGDFDVASWSENELEDGDGRITFLLKEGVQSGKFVVEGESWIHTLLGSYYYFDKKFDVLRYLVMSWEQSQETKVSVHKWDVEDVF